MLNSVGLQGTGVAAWLADDLPGLLATGTRVVASIWGRSVADYCRHRKHEGQNGATGDHELGQQQEGQQQRHQQPHTPGCHRIGRLLGKGVQAEHQRHGEGDDDG